MYMYAYMCMCIIKVYVRISLKRGKTYSSKLLRGAYTNPGGVGAAAKTPPEIYPVHNT